MPKVQNNTQKAKDLKSKLTTYLHSIQELEANIKKAIAKAGGDWKDAKFQDLINTYEKYKKEIKKFEDVLNEATQKKLPDLIKQMEKYDETDATDK